MRLARPAAITWVVAGLFACKATPEVEPREPGSEPTNRGGAVLVEAEPDSDPSLLGRLLVDGSAGDLDRAVQALEQLRERDDVTEELVSELIEQLARLTAAPDLDAVPGREGELRMKFCERLGELGDPAAVDVLLATVRAPEGSQPRAVYKAAIRALGRLGDARAVEELLAVQFRIADMASTTSIPEYAIAATGAIGEPAVPVLLDTLAGRNTSVEELARKVGVDASIVHMTAVRMLAVVGSAKATAALVEFMPKSDCTKRPPRDPDGDEILARAFVANALGYVADEAAVPALCSCRSASRQPADLWEIATALGRIGGTDAFECLEAIVSEGSYDPEALGSPDFEFEIRWEGFRWLVLAAPPDRFATIEALLKSSKPKVRKEIERLDWMTGANVLQECKEDVYCYERVLTDATRSWFEREVAAFNYARMSAPGDIAAATNLARAFKTRDPEARINIAWLAGKVAGGKPCPECAAALENVMRSEELTKEPTMQGAWLTARQTIAKVE